MKLIALDSTRDFAEVSRRMSAIALLENSETLES